VTAIDHPEPQSADPIAAQERKLPFFGASFERHNAQTADLWVVRPTDSNLVTIDLNRSLYARPHIQHRGKGLGNVAPAPSQQVMINRDSPGPVTINEATIPGKINALVHNIGLI
jgi:hypothetical protein